MMLDAHRRRGRLSGKGGGKNLKRGFSSETRNYDNDDTSSLESKTSNGSVSERKAFPDEKVSETGE